MIYNITSKENNVNNLNKQMLVKTSIGLYFIGKWGYIANSQAPPVIICNFGLLNE